MKIFTVKVSDAGLVKRPQETEDGGMLFEFIDDDRIEVRDEYHSMHELYQHRMALNIALFHELNEPRHDSDRINVYKSKLHANGTMFDGYFIVVAETPEGQISYHYTLKHWDKFRIPEKEKCDRYDGHSGQDTIERLMKL